MRIALFTDTYPPEINGVGASCFTLSETLKKHGHEVLIVTTNPYTKRVIFENGIVRIPGRVFKPIYGYRMANIYNKKAMNIIRLFNPEIIHTQTEFGIGIFSRLLAKKFGIPLVYTYHTMYEDYTYYLTRGHFDRIGKSIMRNYAKTSIIHSTQFITPSSKTKDYMRRIGVDGYANIIPTGIDFNLYRKSNINADAVNEIYNTYKISPNKFTLLFLGRVAKEKSINVCIDGYKRFIEDYPNIDSQMVVVGGGPALEDLKKQTKELNISDRVFFTGPCELNNAPNFYALGNVFCSASLSETQGLTYMEAMASELYVLVRYDHNLLDVIIDGKNGYFFENIEEFSRKLKQFYDLWLKNDKTFINESLNIIDNYSIETFYNRVLEVYNRAIRFYW